MKAWNEVTHFAGFDWAKDHHDVLVLDGSGKITSEFRFDHNATGWTLCQEKLKQFPELAIAVEAGDDERVLGVFVGQCRELFQNLDGLLFGEAVLFRDCSGDL